MDLEKQYTGSCLCGGITFALNNISENRVTCYCIDCRKGSGHLGQVLAFYLKDDITIVDEESNMKEWIVSSTQSGYPKRKLFCGKCGCTIATIPMKYNGDKIVVRTSLLDSDFEKFVPKKRIFEQVKLDFVGCAEGAF
ncbi:Mss4-like protein [Dipodascopsis uninucleata]